MGLPLVETRRWAARVLTKRPRRLAVVTILVLGIGISMWGSGVGVGAADDPIRANGTLELGEGEEYYPSNESVRVVVSSNGRTKIVPFEDYVRWECQEVGSRHLQEVLDARYLEPHSSFSTGSSGDHLRATALYNPFEHPDYFHFVRTVPDQVIVTLSFRNQTKTCTLQVKVLGAWRSPQPV